MNMQRTEQNRQRVLGVIGSLQTDVRAALREIRQGGAAITTVLASRRSGFPEPLVDAGNMGRLEQLQRQKKELTAALRCIRAVRREVRHLPPDLCETANETAVNATRNARHRLRHKMDNARIGKRMGAAGIAAGIILLCIAADLAVKQIAFAGVWAAVVAAGIGNSLRKRYDGMAGQIGNVSDAVRNALGLI